MKKFYLISALFLLLFTEVRSQDNTLAVKAGLNLATVTRKKGASYKGGGYYAGVQYTRPFTHFFALQFEAIYSWEGYEYSTSRYKNQRNSIT